MRNLSHTLCSVPLILALNIYFTTANLCSCNHVSYCIGSSRTQPYGLLCIETISLAQGLFTGSNVVLNSIWSPTDYNVCGNDIIDYCGADVRTCFCMQATEQVAMSLTYLIRRQHTCINYVYVCKLCLM